MTKPVFGYWDMRGYGNQIRLLLTYLGVDFEDKRYSFGPGPEPSDAEWLADKPNLGLEFPNLPYWIDGSVRLTESKAILRYIALSKRPSLVPDTPELQAKVHMVEGVANDLQIALVTLAYSPTGKSDVPIEESQAPKLAKLDEYLSIRPWSAGENISYVDFFVYEMLKHYTKFKADFLKPYPAITAYMQRFEALPELAEYLKSIENVICYSPHSTIKM